MSRWVKGTILTVRARVLYLIRTRLVRAAEDSIVVGFSMMDDRLFMAGMRRRVSRLRFLWAVVLEATEVTMAITAADMIVATASRMVATGMVATHVVDIMMMR